MEKEIVTVYEPDRRAKVGFFKSWVFMVKNVVKSRELIWQLFKRDFTAGYKQSFLGIFWILISPVVGILSWVFLNSTGVLKPGNVGVPYPVYVLLGTTIWGLFMSFYSSTAVSLSSGSVLILQINFAHEALVAQQVAKSVVNFLINLVMIFIVLLIFGIVPRWQIIFFPFTLLPIFFIGAGVGMIVAVIAVVAHDINNMVTMGLGFLMFLTPVVYAPKFESIIIRWNPMTYLIDGARDIIILGQITHFDSYLYACLFAATVFAFSWRLFFLSEHKVAEKL